MARPDLSVERSQQILDAFSRCVARSGLDATSLEEVAGEAGMRRSIIRHYVGNRQDLVAAFLDQLGLRLQRQNDDMRAWFVANPGLGGLARYLFADVSSDELLVMESLYSAARRNPTIASRLAGWQQDFTDALEAVLCASLPDADENDITAASHGLAAIYSDHQSMRALGAPLRHGAMALAAADMLIQALVTRARP